MAALGDRTTAEQALQGQRLKGKTAIVTGADSGLGVETARVLALAGAHVTLACRSPQTGQWTANQLRSMLPSGVRLLAVQTLDLSDLVSVKTFADWYLVSGRALDLLINNAGIVATPLATTAQGFELQMGTNHIGHFYLTKLLRPLLEKSPAARIVTVSSELHKQGRAESLLATMSTDPAYKKRSYEPFRACGDSKLANILFTRSLVKRLPSNVLAFSLHPGVIATNLSRNRGVLGPVCRFVGRFILKSVPQGAATTIYAATASELATRSGIYLSDCEEKALNPTALDGNLAETLWDLSERAIGTV